MFNTCQFKITIKRLITYISLHSIDDIRKFSIKTIIFRNSSVHSSPSVGQNLGKGFK